MSNWKSQRLAMAMSRDSSTRSDQRLEKLTRDPKSLAQHSTSSSLSHRHTELMMRVPSSCKPLISTSSTKRWHRKAWLMISIGKERQHQKSSLIERSITLAMMFPLCPPEKMQLSVCLTRSRRSRMMQVTLAEANWVPR